MSIVAKAPNEDDRLRELENCLATDKLVAFVGSGASYGVYDEWKALVRKLCDACLCDCVRPWDTMTADALIDAAEDAKSKNKDAYYAALEHAFSRKPNSRNVYRYLAEANFRNYITTNFDNLLADELAQHPANRENENNFIIFPYPDPMSPAFHRSKTVIHIHGYIKPGRCPSDRNPIILARSEFNAAYSKDSRVMSLLTILFTDYPVCFIGASLQELPLLKVLKQAQCIRRDLESTHRQSLPPLFILLENMHDPLGSPNVREFTNLPGSSSEAIPTPTTAQKEEDETQYYETLGLKVVRYPYKPDHMGLDDLLRKWARTKDARIQTVNWGG